jgi:NitT/TauT family transport system substrate-binding protein
VKLSNILALAAAALLAACSPAKKPEQASGALTPVRFATDWRAQAEQGGFYQALATGEYAKRGLDVKIVPGGPGVNVPQLVVSGAVDLGMGSDNFIVMNLVQEKAPVKAVAAFMQKNPQVLIAHQGQGIGSIADMKGRPIMISDAAVSAWWAWLRARHGFTDAQVRKYTHSSAPFLADKTLIQEGYLTSEPYTIEKQGHEKPSVFLLADDGYPSYAAMVLATDSLIRSKPEAVKAFVEASAAGWKSYLEGDPRPADALILRDNPEMTQDILDQARDKMRRYGIVTSDGVPIGAMSDARWADFFKVASAQGIYPKTLDYRRAYTLQFAPAAK